MKKTFLFILLFSFSLCVFAQIKEIQLPGKNIQPAETEFSFRYVIYEKDDADPIGLYQKDGGIKPMLIIGEDPARMITDYLKKKYPKSATKIELVAKVTEIKISRTGFVNGMDEYEIETAMKFYILRGQVLVIVGNAKSTIMRKADPNNPVYGHMLADGIDAAIQQFSSSNWKEHPLIILGPSAEEQEPENQDQQFTNQKKVYTIKPEVKRKVYDREDYNHLGFSFGYSHRLAEIPENLHPEQQKIIEGLIGGMNVNIAYGNYFSGNWGMGLMFSYAFAESSGTDVPFADYNTGQVHYVDVTDKVNVGLIGPALCFRANTPPTAKFTYHGDISLGYIFYNELFSLDGESLDINGSTIGLQGVFSLDFMLSANFYLTANAGFLIGSLSSYDVNGQKIQLTENENLNRVDLNLGLNFAF